MPEFPVPDRSNFTPNTRRDDETLPEGDIGSGRGCLSDGRPFVIEAWYTEGITLVTFFFSTLGLEDAAPEELLNLLARELESEVPPEFRKLSPDSVRKLIDASGHEMFTLTFVVGMPPI